MPICTYTSMYIYVMHPHLTHRNVQLALPSPVSFAEVLGLVAFCQAPTPGIVVIAIVLGYGKVRSKPHHPQLKWFVMVYSWRYPYLGRIICVCCILQWIFVSFPWHIEASSLRPLQIGFKVHLKLRMADK